MKAKLTLLLDKGTLDEAKEYAQEHGTSLSRIVEDFLRSAFGSAPKSTKRTGRVSDKVCSLRGVISLPKDFDHRIAYSEHLTRKHK